MEPSDKFFSVLLVISAVAIGVAIFLGCVEISEYRKTVKELDTIAKQQSTTTTPAK